MCITGELAVLIYLPQINQSADEISFSMEYMDAGSLTELAGGDVPENVLARVTGCMVRGLRFLKDELQTMHRGKSLLCFMTSSNRLRSVYLNHLGHKTSSLQMYWSTKRARSNYAILAFQSS